MRLLNIFVIGALVLAASYVYKIKFDSTLQAERVAKVRTELRRERDAIAALRVDWARLETPPRIEALAQRYTRLKPVDPNQFDDFSQLPERPPSLPRPKQDDPLAALLALPDPMRANMTPFDTHPTGSISAPAEAPQ
jgi:hypothetical protein